MARARIEIKLIADDEVVVHHFQRATTALQQDSIQRMCQAALGWLQAYGDQANLAQWEMEAQKAKSGSVGEPSASSPVSL